MSEILIHPWVALPSKRGQVTHRIILIPPWNSQTYTLATVVRLSCRVSDMVHWLLPSRAIHAIQTPAVLLYPYLTLTFSLQCCTMQAILQIGTQL